MKTSILAAGTVVLVALVIDDTAHANSDPLAFFHTTETAKSEPATGVQAVPSVTAPSGGGASAEVLRLADQMGVPRGLALAVCNVETRCRYGLVGRQGERGPLQIKLPTARGLGYSGGAAGLNGHAGAYWGMKHLAEAYRRCGSARGAAKLHQAGLASSCSGSAYASRVMAQM
jgi:soluble lytic murein transglycosylase-like protein